MEFVDLDDFINGGVQLVGEPFRKYGAEIYDLSEVYDKEDARDEVVETLQRLLLAFSEIRAEELKLHRARVDYCKAIDKAVDYFVDYRDPVMPTSLTLKAVREAIDEVEKAWYKLVSAEYDYSEALKSVAEIKEDGRHSQNRELRRLSRFINVTETD